MPAARPTRTVAQKMGVAPGSRAHLCGAPATATAAMDLPDLDLPEQLGGEFDYLHLFTTRQHEMRAAFPDLRDHLRPGGMLWVSWPKGGRLGTDLTIKSVIAIGYELGMVESTCLRIDDVWAGLKFTHPKPGKVYANSYGTLPEAAP
ncbi:class I SAM-dependent methyltransferase [Nocardioides sp. CPCC 205120]|uniref:class I SAM-dependent methyltransferase n=1 Tax=Nocardioides sp. CPCC 205120 TaxID=3406462 RepID=UPI003B5142AC